MLHLRLQFLDCLSFYAMFVKIILVLVERSRDLVDHAFIVPSGTIIRKMLKGYGRSSKEIWLHFEYKMALPTIDFSKSATYDIAYIRGLLYFTLYTVHALVVGRSFLTFV